MKYLLIFVAFILSCNGNNPTETKKQDSLADAKWYYYAYACDLKAYDTNRVEVDPLTCGIKFCKSIKLSNDTTKIFFRLFSNDSNNLCTLIPLDLNGVIQVKKGLFTPIYHMVYFDDQSDSTLKREMISKELLLQGRIKTSKDNINNWLNQEAIKRNIIK